MRKLVLSGLAVFIFATPLVAQEKRAPFFRLEAIEYTQDEVPNELRLNLPLSLLKAVQPTIDEALVDADFGFYHTQFRMAWEEIKNTGPFTVVELHHEGETIRVSTTKTHVVINANNKDFGNAVIRIPLSIGDALFNMEETVTFAQVLTELELHSGQDLVTIESDKVDLRIWVD